MSDQTWYVASARRSGDLNADAKICFSQAEAYNFCASYDSADYTTHIEVCQSYEAATAEYEYQTGTGAHYDN